jgi:uncharacterized protein (TIGR02145 family)
MKNFITLLFLLIWASSGCEDPNDQTYDTLVLEIVATPASTQTAADGALDLTVTGGKSPFTYSWSNGATTEDIGNLTVGLYTVTVTSDDGQTAADSAAITAPPDTESLTDYDGNTYPIVQIGSQIWMAENFRGLHTAGGEALTGVYAYNDNQSNVAEFGRLYTWDTALSANPTGWHLPTDAEWDTLAAFLGPDAGAQLKVGGGSGFNAPLGGYRFYQGGYQDLNSWGMFWTATYSGMDHASVRNLFPDNPELVPSGYGVVGAISVRYVRD